MFYFILIRPQNKKAKDHRDLLGRLKKGDEIMMINITSVTTMTLQQIDALFRSRDGRPFFLLIERDKKYMVMHLTLKRRV